MRGSIPWASARPLLRFIHRIARRRSRRPVSQLPVHPVRVGSQPEGWLSMDTRPVCSPPLQHPDQTMDFGEKMEFVTTRNMPMYVMRMATEGLTLAEANKIKTA